MEYTKVTYHNKLLGKTITKCFGFKADLDRWLAVDWQQLLYNDEVYGFSLVVKEVEEL